MAHLNQPQCQCQLRDPAKTIDWARHLHATGKLYRGSPKVKNQDRQIKILAHYLGVPCDPNEQYPYQYDLEFATVREFCSQLDAIEAQFGFRVYLGFVNASEVDAPEIEDE